MIVKSGIVAFEQEAVRTVKISTLKYGDVFASKDMRNFGMIVNAVSFESSTETEMKWGDSKYPFVHLDEHMGVGRIDCYSMDVDVYKMKVIENMKPERERSNMEFIFCDEKPKHLEKDIFDMLPGEMFMDAYNDVCMVVNVDDYAGSGVDLKQPGEIRKCFIRLKNGRINSYAKQTAAQHKLLFKMLKPKDLEVSYVLA